MAWWVYALAGLVTAILMGGYLLLRARTLGRIRSQIAPEPEAWEEGAQPSSQPSGVAPAVVGGSAALEQFGDLMQLDPDVMSAFERAMGDGTIDSAPAVAAFAERYLTDPTSPGYQIQMNRITGFAGEARVERLLRDQGHDANLHATTNAPGTDITVDGVAYQVKTTSSESVVFGHLDRYPMEPVIVPSELSHLAEGSSLVTTVPGFDLTSLTTDLTGSLGGAADYVNPLEGLAPIPILSVGLAGFRAYRGYKTTNVTLGRALEEFGIDATLLTIGIMGGKSIGGVVAVAGLAHGLPTEPTTMMIVGGAAGGYAGHRASRGVKDLRRWKAARDFARASEKLGRLLLSGLPDGERAPVIAARRAARQSESAYRRRALREAVWPSMKGQMLNYLMITNQRNLATVTKAVGSVEKLALSHIEKGDWKSLGDLTLANPWLAREGGFDVLTPLLAGLDARSRIARELFLKAEKVPQPVGA